MNNRVLIISRLTDHIEELDRLLGARSESELKHRPAPGKWSLYEIVMHLVETQDVFIERATRMLVEDKPAIKSFTPDTARQEGWYLTQNFKSRLQTFKEQRSTFIALLKTFTDEQWKAEGRHEGYARYTIEQCTESLMRHEEHHLYQVLNLVYGALR